MSSAETARYGGHTTSIDVSDGSSQHVLVDAGTGITQLPASRTPDPATAYHVFLTHYHWDHIQGLLFFRPLFEPGNTFTFYGHEWNGAGCREALESVLRPPWFPVSISEAPCTKRYVTVTSSPVEVGRLTVTAAPLHHPQGVTAYRLDGPNRSVVIATDCERGDPTADKALRELASGADVLVHDAQYSPEEYETHYVGWGHSTWAHAAEAAHEAGVKELVLVSHDPSRTDDQIDGIVSVARREFANTRAAFEGMHVEL